MPETVVAVDHGRGAGLLHHLNVRRRIGPSVAQAIDVLPQSEAAMGVVAVEIRFDHQPCDCRSVLRRNAEGGEAVDQQALKLTGWIAALVSGHGQSPLAVQIRAPA